MNTLFTLLLLLAALAAVFACAWHWNRSTHTASPQRTQRSQRRTPLAARLQLRCQLLVIRLNEALVIPFRYWIGVRRRPVEFANIAEGQRPTGNRTYLADAAITTRYLLVKLGSDANHIAVCSAVTDNPIGVCTDEPAAAEDEANVQLLGAASGTLRVVSGAAIAAGAYVATTATGKVQTAIATQFAIGRALNASAGADEFIEIDPIRSDRAL